MTLGFCHPSFCGDFESILAIDNNEDAINTFNHNFGQHGVCADIEKWLSENEVPKAHIVIGGPPCQGFSLLNKNRKGDSRRALWEPYMDFVHLSGASVFIMENVVGLLKSDEFLDIKQRAKDLGFRLVNPSVLNMAHYGVPQTRKRAIVMGVKEDFINTGDITFPPPKTHQEPGQFFALPEWLTVKDAIADLPEPEGTDIRSELGFPLDLHFGRNPTKMSLERYKAVPPGGNRFDLQKNRPDITPNCWLKKKSGGTDLFGRLWWDRPSVTIRTEFFKPEKGRYLHPESNRPITHREAARIMSFPDTFVFTGSKIEIARQIGNAVPPAFAGVIAKHVSKIMQNMIFSTEKSYSEPVSA